ncbi:proteasome-activating nucleotidase [Immersiella caudata]|uniref:Proteasome-activating nucleotidase n=1 Tax=Immersiella caudata TaxID=314043 RepID=A0AA40C3T2_9PEZI|nr:proteasome-activating nucleotidase [Immersiella caudata]
MANDMSHQGAYERWLEHNSQPQKSTELNTFALLRAAYPNHHVSETTLDTCDLLGYADAGFATAVPEDTPFNHFVRNFEAPESRIDRDKGKVVDAVLYGCWRYRWRGIDFLVYKSTYITRWGLTTLFFVLHPDTPDKRHNAATDALLHECGKWSKELHNEVYVFDNVQWKKSKSLWQSIDGSSWDDVILAAGMKERLIHDVQHFFDTRHIYRASNVPWKRGVILHGLPGNGKTVSVKALINSLAKRPDPIPSLYVKSLDACQGPKYSIQLIFKHARAMAPCLLVFEDLDSLITPKTRSYFLNEVDGLESNDGILMIGSTNYLDRLDAAITKRPSRFDRKYHFKLPDEDARLSYALYWSRKFSKPSAIVHFPETLCPVIAKITKGFSFAYMKELFIASLLAHARGATEDDDFLDAPEAVADKTDKAGSTTSEEPVVVGEEDKAVQQPEKKGPVEVEVPEELKDNIFLRFIMGQAEILHREMESTDKEDVPMASCEVDADEGQLPFPWMSITRQLAR